MIDERINSLYDADALVKTFKEACHSIVDFINSLEPYQRYELMHPRKKPRASIRRKRRRRCRN